MCVQVEGRLAIAGKSLTNSVVRFSYFSVANANTTVAFGPGVLSGSAATVPTVFVIQARDNASANRYASLFLSHGQGELNPSLERGSCHIGSHSVTLISAV